MQKDLSFFLVDDDADDRDIFVMALTHTGHMVKCTTAKDGHEALVFLEKNKDFVPDYIFLDLNMPKINGKECLAEMRKIERLKKTPICIYSTSYADKDIAETSALGATEFITKPYSIKTLTELLSNIILNILDKSANSFRNLSF